MKTIEETYVQYLCSVCKNKHTDLCCIRKRLDNTAYCESYEGDIVKRKKTPVMWQGW